jgi:hypothetical protein
MKTTVKNSLLALTITVSIVACKGKGSANVDSVSSDRTSSTKVIDSLKKDTNSMTPDSLKKDTTVHTSTTTTTTTTETKHTKN